MMDDRSPRPLAAVFLLMAALFLFSRLVIDRAPVRDWGLPALLAALGAGLLAWDVWQRRPQPAPIAPSDPAHPMREYLPPPTETSAVVAASSDTVAAAEIDPDVYEQEIRASSEGMPPPVADAILDQPADLPPPPAAPVLAAPPATIAMITEAEPIASAEPTAPAAPVTEPLVTPLPVTDTPPPAETITVVEAVAEPPPVAAPVAPLPPARKKTKSGGDDLTIIEGIGPKISAALVAAGIPTFEELARTPESRIRDILEAAKLRILGNVSASIPTWSYQAQMAAEGRMDDLRQWQAARKAGQE